MKINTTISTLSELEILNFQINNQVLCIHQMFEMQVNLTPDAIAVIFEKSQLTYEQLNQRANQLANYLRGLGVGKDVLVGVCLERSLEMIVGLLAILKAGGAYVPLDPAYPADRLAFILEDTQTPILLTQEKFFRTLPPHQAQVVCLDVDWEIIAKNSQENPVFETNPDHLIYAIYTSGSTGQPKGVMITHRGIYNQLLWRQTTFQLTSNDKVLQNISFSFDPSVWQIFWPLCYGAKLVLAKPGGHQDTGYLIKLIDKEQITVIALVPSLLRVLLEEPDIEKCQYLRHITCGGEALSVELIERFFVRLNLDNVLHNCYGPTEYSIDTTFWTCQRQTNHTIAPIGRPIANTQIYILDENLKLLPIGEAGELYIGGAGLARGYLNRPQLTQEKFISNPFESSKLYKTGDLARYLPDGNIEFLGRIDYQVKIRGFRIELGEIETLLHQHSGLQQSIVIASEDVPGNKQLIAYLVANPEQILSSGELRDFLRKQLPDYMIPAAFVFLDSLPLNPNGKIDRRALPVPNLFDFGDSTNFVAPSNPTEELLANIWKEVLSLEKIGIHDNFFALGGHSLLATRVISRCRQAFAMEIPLQLLFENPTVASLAEGICKDVSCNVSIGKNVLTISTTNNRGLIPLSFAQQRVWFLQKLEPHSSAYIISKAFRLTGNLNVALLQKSLNTIVSHHEALRTNFITGFDGNPIQMIGLPRSVELNIIDVTQEQVQELLNKEAQRSFNLESDLMLRGTLLQINSQEYILLLMMHHIASDGWSMGILWKQLASVYAAFVNGESLSLPTLPIQYADFAIWQRQWLSGEVLATQLNYWKNQLAGAKTVLELPTDKPRPVVQTYRGASQSLMLPQTLSKSLKELSQQKNVTLFMMLLTAFGTLLHRYSGQEDILIGSPIAGRDRAEIEGLIGFFINTVVVRTDFSKNPSFLALLSQVRQQALGAYAHQDTPFEKLVEELQPERDTSRNPLFQVWFNMLNLGDIELPLSGMVVEPVSMLETASKFDLTLYVTEQQQGIQLELVYNTDLFIAAKMVEMLDQFHHLLNQIVILPDNNIANYSLVTPKSQFLLPEPRAVLPEPEYQLVAKMFADWVQKNPAQPAISQGDQIWNYGKLNNKAEALAQVLLNHGIQCGDVVALLGTRSLGLIASMIAILLSGGVLLLIDSTLPSDRQKLMLETAKAKYILHINSQQSQTEDVICVHPNTGEVINSQIENYSIIPLPQITGNDAAYIFFTSGTTGVPKGVLGCHKGMSHFLIWQRQTFEIGTQDRIGQLTALSFDVVLRDIFLPLTSGATLCLPDWETNQVKSEDNFALFPISNILEPTQVLKWLEREKITVMHTVPSLAQLWLTNVPEGISLHSLRWLFLAGEPLKETLINQWRRKFPQSGKIINLYGPTETTLAKCYYEIPAEPTPGIQPIGLPIPETQALIFTANHQLCGIGEIGEIVLRTPFHSLGYINTKENNNSRFVNNPFRNDENDQLYYTGDLGRYRLDGSLEILGRRDYQVKIRGVRIEPGEIEAVLLQHSDIHQVVVIAREDIPGDQRLVAYIIPNQNSAPSINEFRQFLSTKLPQYMIPSAFVMLNVLPLNPNGKVDRRSLPPTDLSKQESQNNTFVAARNDVERQLIEIWEQVLGVHPIGIRDNFFELGGHSLLAVKLFWQIEQKFGKSLPLATLFKSGNIENLAHQLSSETKSTNSCSSLVEIQPLGSKPPFFCIHGLGGEVLCFRDLSKHLGTDQPFYALQAQGLNGNQPFHTKVEDMASHYIQEIKTIQPQGPYFLGGYSFGGLVVFEMARQLHEQGEKIAFLAVLDTCLVNHIQRDSFLKRILLHFHNIQQKGLSYLFHRIIDWSKLGKDQMENSYMLYLESINALPDNDKHLLITSINTEVASKYIVPVYPGQMTLLRTEDQSRTSAVGFRYDPQYGWGDLVMGGLNIQYVPGSHHSLLEEPHVQVVAEKLKDCLEDV